MQFETNSNRAGLIGTAVFHTVVISILCFSYLMPPDPPYPAPEGLTVNIGNSETGLGPDEPAEAGSVQEKSPMAESVSPEETVVEKTETAPQEVVSQEVEDAPAIEAKLKKQEQARKMAEEAERINREAAESKKIAEEKKLAEEAERQRLDAERKRIDAINSRAKGAFGKGSGTSTSQGIAGGTGNQGKPDGQAGVNNYNGGGTGNGVDWSLNGRSAISVPPPSSGIQEEGKVVVEIIVDKDGNVVDARGGLIGSTTTDARLVKLATDAASKAKFNISPNSPDRQKGKITYVFELK